MIQAYSLYKTEALKEAQEMDDGETEALMQIKAQSLYRQGAFGDAVLAFKAVKDVMDEEEDAWFLDMWVRSADQGAEAGAGFPRQE